MQFSRWIRDSGRDRGRDRVKDRSICSSRGREQKKAVPQATEKAGAEEEKRQRQRLNYRGRSRAGGRLQNRREQ